MDQIGNFLGTLMQSRNQAHIYHLQTNSFAQHKALQDYYESIVDLIDTLAEQYQGKYGIVRGYKMENSIKEDGKPLLYFEALFKFVDTTRSKLPQDSFFQNSVDEVSTLVSKTIYLLRELK